MANYIQRPTQRFLILGADTQIGSAIVKEASQLPHIQLEVHVRQYPPPYAVFGCHIQPVLSKDILARIITQIDLLIICVDGENILNLCKTLIPIIDKKKVKRVFHIGHAGCMPFANTFLCMPCYVDKYSDTLSFPSSQLADAEAHGEAMKLILNDRRSFQYLMIAMPTKIVEDYSQKAKSLVPSSPSDTATVDVVGTEIFNFWEWLNPKAVCKTSSERHYCSCISLLSSVFTDSINLSTIGKAIIDLQSTFDGPIHDRCALAIYE